VGVNRFRLGNKVTIACGGVGRPPKKTVKTIIANTQKASKRVAIQDIAGFNEVEMFQMAA
jgi:hypothetical protein